MQKEIWKDIIGYEGLYQVSNLGNVKSLNYGRSGKVCLLKLKIHTGNYFQVVLCNRKCKNKYFYVHRLVAQHFIFNSENKRCINHKDCNKQNNKVENLEWVTYKENQKHAFANGLNFSPALKGEQHGRAKLTLKDVNAIRELYSKGNISQREIANKYNMGESTISSIINYKTWQ